MSSAAISVLLFIVTLTLVIWRPRGLGIGWIAAGGGLLALLLHVVTVADVWEVTRIVWDATLTFVGIIMTSTVLDRMGFFEWAALKMAHAANGDGRRVFFYVTLLGAMVSAFFSNDGAALILTPIVLEKVRLLKFDAKRTLPFIIASGFVADTTSLPLIVSNLVNIVSADFFHVGFVSYAVHMVVPDLFSLIASVMVLYLFFWKDIPRVYDPVDLPEASESIADLRMFRWTWVLLALLMAGYILTEVLHIPVSVVAGVIAMGFLVLGQRYRVVRSWTVVKGAPWSIVFFSIGMYVVVYGLRDAGLIHLLGGWIRWSTGGGLFAATLATGYLAALLSNVMNNLPAVMVGALSVHAAGVTGAMHQALIYANVIGCDLGPKITPLGSLATLLWLHILSQRGVTISWRQYVKSGFILTIPTLFITLSGLYLWLSFVG